MNGEKKNHNISILPEVEEGGGNKTELFESVAEGESQQFREDTLIPKRSGREPGVQRESESVC